MSPRLVLGCLLLAVLGLLPLGRLRVARGGAEPALPELPLSIGVAAENGSPAVSAAWVDEQLAEARRLLGAHGIRVAEVERRSLPAEAAAVETPEDRDALVAHVQKKVVNVLYVRSLRDIDHKDRFIQGVRWRLRSKVSVDWVIVSANASPTTTAHELGHFFGLGHSPTVNNLMSYERTDPTAVAFDGLQGAKMRRTIRWLLGAKALAPIPAAAPAASAETRK